ncbi:MAG: MBL fold metallo-hydrolase [Ignavibacteriae bacterium HGW-Ignavibacteriae-4]|jgi:metallo-beta-lactamase family protein|nr:MAG: MBL fold metallo-hydrolase [Ignavibacteriae bacterium HGW-Ignavibacteriae-4]
MNSNLKIHFLGAAGTVTGSKYLVDTGDKKIMIDCGMFQGLKKLRLLNWNYPPVKVSEIDVILLTHGHADHTAFLPRLVNMGFNGLIRATKPTLDIASIIIRDSAKIQEEEAERANKYGYSKHEIAEPLYNMIDAENAISRFNSLEDGIWIELYPDIKVRFQYNGHILGSTFIELEVRGEVIVFSGDVGRKSDLLLREPKKPQKADYLLIESTYGGKIHENLDLEEELSKIINHTYDKNGTLIIPSFAVERAQTLMYLLWKLREKGKIPKLPMIMDSPMGNNVLEVFRNHKSWHKMSANDSKQMCNAFIIVKDFRETLNIMDDKQPKIVIAGSGMVTGGRVLNYLTEYIEDPSTTVMLAGFQAEGTRGRQLLEGASDIKIYGKYYNVNAEIYNMTALSAHADQAELIDWLSDLDTNPKKVFIVHGEPHSSDAFRVKLKDTFGWDCILPELYDMYELK